MNVLFQYWLRTFWVIFFLDGSSLAFGQDRWTLNPRNSIRGDLYQEWNSFSLSSMELRHQFHINDWLNEADVRRGEWGLRHAPDRDQNVYLLYGYELTEGKSKAEIGFSMSNFNAFTLKFSHSFSIQDLVR